MPHLRSSAPFARAWLVALTFALGACAGAGPTAHDAAEGAARERALARKKAARLRHARRAPARKVALPRAPDEEDSDQAAIARLPRGTLVLHIGDSFADSLGGPLGKHLVGAGLRNVLLQKTPSYTPTWAYRADLKNLIARYNPDLLLITLGANEFDIPNPSERATAIERIVNAAGGRPCVWISPPRWKADTGILSVIREHAAPCRYLDSDALVGDLPRAHDGIHPSEVGRQVWADAVFIWLAHAREEGGDKPWTLRSQGDLGNRVAIGDESRPLLAPEADVFGDTRHSRAER